ncbi:Ap2-associated protein kinase 1 [Plakobranchus ocellatus]|uniref:Ap2-associated protein kinase 1 n=1 Tax=Plakobranchus ocellatus TaxID=259542 RepID=A0AAV3ZC88_9GAST|nr:Ap2-associated protein kinase 1 [Plakobranchus ocellatus]
MISGFQALLQANRPVAELEPATIPVDLRTDLLCTVHQERATTESSDSSHSNSEEDSRDEQREALCTGDSDGQLGTEVGRARDFLGAGQLMAALNRAKYSHLVDSDDACEEKRLIEAPSKGAPPAIGSGGCEDRSYLLSESAGALNVKGISMAAGPSTSLDPRDRRESNSSYAEEDHPSVGTKRPIKNDFNYQELDDEFGSRPVDPAAPLTMSLKQNSAEVSPGQAYSINPDRIVGHEYGVRPLLDDDELQDSYSGHTHSSVKSEGGSLSRLHSYGIDGGMTNQGLSTGGDPKSVQHQIIPGTAVKQEQAAVASEPAKADAVDSAAMTTSSSSVISPDMDSSFDVFSAAPFKARSSKRNTPSQVLASGPSAASANPADVFESAPFKYKSSKHSSGSSTVTSPGSSQLHHSQDVFGSAPFSPPATAMTPGSTCPSSSTVSPSMDDIMFIKTPDDAQPGSLPSAVSGHGLSSGFQQQHQHQLSGGAVPVHIDSWHRGGAGAGVGSGANLGSGGAGTSFGSVHQDVQLRAKNSNVSVPYPDSSSFAVSDDPFGGVPWNKAFKRSLKKNRVESSIPITSADSFPQTSHQSAQMFPQPVKSSANFPPSSSNFQPLAPTQANTMAVESKGYQLQQLQANVQSVTSTRPKMHQGQVQPTVKPAQPQPVMSSSLQTFASHQAPGMARPQEGFAAQRPGNLPMPVVPSGAGAAAHFLQHQHQRHHQEQQQRQQQEQHQRQSWGFNNGQGEEQQQPDWDAMRNNVQDDGGSYQRLKTKTDPSSSSSSSHQGKRSSRDVSTSAFANMSFNDEDELDATSPRESPLGAATTGSLRMSPAVSGVPTKGKSSSPSFGGVGESGRAVVVAAAQSSGYDTGTWPRKHRRHQAKAEPFSVSKKL